MRRYIAIGRVIWLIFDVIGEEAVVTFDFSLRFLLLLELKISFSEGSRFDSNAVAETFLPLLLDYADHVENSLLELLKLSPADAGFREVGDEGGQYFRGKHLAGQSGGEVVVDRVDDGIHEPI